MPKEKKRNVVYVSKHAVPADTKRDPSKEPYPSPYTDEERQQLRGSALRQEHDRAVIKATDAARFSEWWNIPGPYSQPDLSSMSAQATADATSLMLDGWLDGAADVKAKQSKAAASTNAKSKPWRDQRNRRIFADYDAEFRAGVSERRIPGVLARKYALLKERGYDLSPRQIKNIVRRRKVEIR
jgi:hypothetical protein